MKKRGELKGSFIKKENTDYIWEKENRVKEKSKEHVVPPFPGQLPKKKSRTRIPRTLAFPQRQAPPVISRIVTQQITQPIPARKPVKAPRGKKESVAPSRRHSAVDPFNPLEHDANARYCGYDGCRSKIRPHHRLHRLPDILPGVRVCFSCYQYGRLRGKLIPKGKSGRRPRCKYKKRDEFKPRKFKTRRKSRRPLPSLSEIGPPPELEEFEPEHDGPSNFSPYSETRGPVEISSANPLRRHLTKKEEQDFEPRDPLESKQFKEELMHHSPRSREAEEFDFQTSPNSHRNFANDFQRDVKPMPLFQNPAPKFAENYQQPIFSPAFEPAPPFQPTLPSFATAPTFSDEFEPTMGQGGKMLS